MHPNFYLFCSNGVLELLLSKPGLPQRPSHLWETAWVRILQMLVDHGQQGLEPVHRSCRLHCQYWGLSAYYLMYKGDPLLLGPLVYGADPSTPTEALLFMDGCGIFIVEVGTKQGVSCAAAMLMSLSLCICLYWGLNFFTVQCHFISPPLSTSYRVGLVVMISLSFCLSGNVLISPSFSQDWIVVLI